MTQTLLPSSASSKLFPTSNPSHIQYLINAKLEYCSQLSTHLDFAVQFLLLHPIAPMTLYQSQTDYGYTSQSQSQSQSMMAKTAMTSSSSSSCGPVDAARLHSSAGTTTISSSPVLSAHINAIRSMLDNLNTLLSPPPPPPPPPSPSPSSDSLPPPPPPPPPPQRWLAGTDHCSIADISLACRLLALNMLKVLESDQYSHIVEYVDRVAHEFSPHFRDLATAFGADDNPTTPILYGRHMLLDVVSPKAPPEASLSADAKRSIESSSKLHATIVAKTCNVILDVVDHHKSAAGTDTGIDTDTSVWKTVANKHNIIMCIPSSQSPMASVSMNHASLVHTNAIHCSVSRLCDFLLPLHESLAALDSCITDSRVVYNNSDSTQTCYMKLNVHQETLQTKRSARFDFAIMVHTRTLADGTVIVTMDSTDIVPKQPGCVRSRIHQCGWLIRPTSANSCHVYIYSHIVFPARVPVWVIEQLARKPYDYLRVLQQITDSASPLQLPTASALASASSASASAAASAAVLSASALSASASASSATLLPNNT
jgi:START domain